MEIRSELEVIEHLDRIATHHAIDYHGRTVCWREFGAGAPLVLLHGGHGSWLHWARNIEALSASRRVLVPDLPGYGDSDALDAGSGYAGLARAVAATLDRLLGSGAAFDLAGFSFGSVVAGQVALLHGGVRSLTLLGAVGHGLRRRHTGTMLAWEDAPDEQTMLARLRHNLGVLMLHGPADSLALEIHRRSCLRARFASKRISYSPALTEALAQLAIPVLMLWGEHEPTGDPVEVGAAWEHGHPERVHGIIAGAGHWVQYEAADEVNRRLLAWLGKPGG